MLTTIVHYWDTYGLLAAGVLFVALLTVAVALASAAHAMADWNPKEATKLEHAAAILSAVAHGLEGLVFKWPFTKPPIPLTIPSSRGVPPAGVGLLLVLLLGGGTVRAQEVPAPQSTATTRAREAAAVIAGIGAGAVTAETAIKANPALKHWTETKVGQIVMGCIAGAIVVTSAAGAASVMFLSVR